MDKIFNYRYYILQKNNNSAFGVVDEIFGRITYHTLKLENVFDEFQNKEIETIVKGEEFEADINKLSKNFEEVEITKYYWVVFEHMTGRKRKAINTNDTTI